MANPKQPLEPNNTYHLSNHCVGFENFFNNDDNYIFFLGKIKRWILPIADILTYCLLPNEFHLILKVKETYILNDKFREQLRSKKRINRSGIIDISHNQILILAEIISEQFSHCFNSYAQAYNKVHKRKGALFRHNFERKKLPTHELILRAICNVHNLPVKNGLTLKMEKWKFSSYEAILKNKRSIIAREKALEIFESLEKLVSMHRIFS